mgnify:CR=1 FL=1
MRFLKAMQTSDRGNLQIQITSSVDSFPVPDASIRISYTGIPENTLEELTTDSSGQSETIELDAPPVEYSLDATNEEQPYAEYTLEVNAPGFEPVNIAGTEILAGVTAIQKIRLRPLVAEDQTPEIFVIPAHTLYGVYPPKIPENEIKPVNETGELVRGAGEGIHTAFAILPTLVGLMTAVGILRASGFLKWLSDILGRLFAGIGFPVQLVPLAVVRLFSASAATGFLLDIFKEFGPDSKIGIIASLMLSCTETVFYTMSVYFMAAKVTKTRYTLAGALLSVFAGIAASFFLGNFLQL